MRAQNLTRVNSSSFLEFAKRRIIFRNFLFKDVYFQSFFVDPKFHSLYKIEERKLFCFSLVNPCHFIVLAIFSSVFKYFFYWCLLFHSFCVLCIFFGLFSSPVKASKFSVFYATFCVFKCILMYFSVAYDFMQFMFLCIYVLLDSCILLSAPKTFGMLGAEMHENSREPFSNLSQFATEVFALFLTK